MHFFLAINYYNRFSIKVLFTKMPYGKFITAILLSYSKHSVCTILDENVVKSL